MGVIMVRQVGFESLCQFAPREQDAPTTAVAFQADIRAETCDCPFVGAAGMLFAELEMVVEAEVGEHGGGRIRGLEN